MSQPKIPASTANKNFSLKLSLKDANEIETCLLERADQLETEMADHSLGFQQRQTRQDRAKMIRRIVATEFS